LQVITEDEEYFDEEGDEGEEEEEEDEDDEGYLSISDFTHDLDYEEYQIKKVDPFSLTQEQKNSFFKQRTSMGYMIEERKSQDLDPNNNEQKLSLSYGMAKNEVLEKTKQSLITSNIPETRQGDKIPRTPIHPEFLS